MSPQRPMYRAYQQDPERVDRWLKEEFPAIERQATKESAEIFFGDEAGIRSDYPSGTTWPPKGHTPVAQDTGASFGLKLLAAISPQGQIRFMTLEGEVNAGAFIGFLRRLVDHQRRPIFLLVDSHPAHKAKEVSAFVESTRGRLRLFFLPPYSPDLNPDELLWNQAKNHKLGRTPVTGPDNLTHRAISALRSLQKLPAKVRALFQAPWVHCAAAANVR